MENKLRLQEGLNESQQVNQKGEKNNLVVSVAVMRYVSLQRFFYIHDISISIQAMI